VGFSTSLPVWFEEGVAQLQEAGKKERAQKYIREVVKSRQHIPLPFLMRWDIRKESDPQKVKVFYLESLSLVDFMIRTYGSSAFGTFCRSLKEGKNFEESLKSAYVITINSVENLEKMWLEYMSQ
jgi:hypothetical protein